VSSDGPAGAAAVNPFSLKSLLISHRKRWAVNRSKNNGQNHRDDDWDFGCAGLPSEDEEDNDNDDLVHISNANYQIVHVPKDRKASSSRINRSSLPRLGDVADIAEVRVILTKRC